MPDKPDIADILEVEWPRNYAGVAAFLQNADVYFLIASIPRTTNVTKVGF